MRAEQPPVPNPLAGIGDEAAAALTDQITAVKRLGWSAIELRTADGIALADLDAKQFSSVLRTVRAADLDVVCLASRIGNWSRTITSPFADDIHELDVLAERCHQLGTRLIRIMSYPNDGLPDTEWRDRALARVTRLAERAAEHGVTLVHENCAGWAGSNADRMLELVREAGGASLRLLFDTGNGVEYGYDSHDLLRRILPHVAHVHIKDAIGAPGDAAYVLPGEGQCRVAESLRLLIASGYPGALSIEPHLLNRPHEGVQAAGSDAEPFVQAGRCLETLLNEAGTPAALDEPDRSAKTGHVTS
ncbi:sugar phosphate isomerase/epimerase [Saccharopolyspora sp. ASAGF58]|uniref:sugar phosphate isomerase/epimerase family protein n=1 Tax=Saccharopolyspora sp. ASAGF58 TaxID=2719023 RepID=UPI00143FCA05|nr:sugar phosphate isomerase/epimerase family protein [Saccharopolyspora sp. ASAGF58]QIZ38858.1 sugar phosphate isomerase/epimerase [Saccharopolyspora sp. ASAGF58]